MYRKLYRVTLMALLLAVCSLTLEASAHPGEHHRAHKAQSVVADWTFVPAYTLEASANNPRTDLERHETLEPKLLGSQPDAMVFNGRSPTDRLLGLLEPDRLPGGAFTVELWINNHVNEPVGAVMAVREREDPEAIRWAVTYEEHRFNVLLADGSSGSHTVATFEGDRKAQAHRRYWWHLVAVYDESKLKLYINGRAVAAVDAPSELADLDDPMLELAGYFENEPYMTWENLVHGVRIHRGALDAEAVKVSFDAFAKRLTDAKLYDNRLHFTAPPYLNHATTEGINILWETDRDTTATLHYGPTSAMENKVRFDRLKRLHELTLDGLEADTPYFYKVVCEDVSGNTIESGQLTFRTAVEEGGAFKFALIGDTETRPHINARLAELIWQDRPNFVINVGDLTDGGKVNERWQWTHEYFVGLGALHGRIPLYPVPGNGEGDLVWYKHYHRLPGNEAYYSYRFGNAEFFMLDSNQREHGFKEGGEQNAWLREQMKKSDAVWKFAAHHHATYTSEENDYGDRWQGSGTNGDPLMQPIIPVYEEYNLDIVFFGHLHLYERSRPFLEGHVDEDHGVVHLLAGGGGGNLEDFAPNAPAFSDKGFRGHHYVLISITGRTISGKMYDLEGRLRDHFQWTKPAAVLTREDPEL
jgi:hypothetical protein